VEGRKAGRGETARLAIWHVATLLQAKIQAQPQNETRTALSNSYEKPNSKSLLGRLEVC